MKKFATYYCNTNEFKNGRVPIRSLMLYVGKIEDTYLFIPENEMHKIQSPYLDLVRFSKHEIGKRAITELIAKCTSLDKQKINQRLDEVKHPEKYPKKYK